MSENMENMDNIIELVDEEGEAVQFEHLATVEHEGDFYIMLTEITDDEPVSDEEVSVVIMKIEKDDEGNDCYVCVEDEDTQNVVFEKFLRMVEEDEDEE